MSRILSVALILFGFGNSFAQQVADETPMIIVNLGNDILGVQQSDRYLTSNIGAGVVVSNMPELIEKIMSQSPNTLYALTIQQQMYTPENLKTSELIPDDRPYAGWLFMRLQSSDRIQNRLIMSAVEIGVVGPASLAEDLQDVIHDWTGSTAPQGWDNQLNNELGINILHLRAHNKRWQNGKFTQEIIGHVGGSLGNVHTFGEAGGLYRVGINVPDDMAAFFLGNSAVGTNQSQSPYSVYLFTAASGRLVLQDIFLDGNTFTDSHNVEKENLVGILKAGVVVGIKGVEFGYAASVATKQFEAQDGASHNGLVFVRFKTKF